MSKKLTKGELSRLSSHFGFDISELPSRQQKILNIVASYREGWCDTDDLEKRLEVIFKNK